MLKLSSHKGRRSKQFVSCNLAVTYKKINAACLILLLFVDFSYIFHKTALDRVCLFTMFTEVQHVSALIKMHFHLPLNSVRLELRSAFESVQHVLNNLGRPKFEFDSANVKYGV